MGLGDEAVDKKIKEIYGLSGALNYLKNNDKYKTFDSDLQAINDYKIAVYKKLAQYAPYIKAGAKDIFESRIIAIDKELKEYSDNRVNLANEIDNPNDIQTALYSAGDDEITIPLNDEKNNLIRSLQEPKWRIMDSFEHNVPSPIHTSLPTKLLCKIIVEGREADVEGARADFESLDLDSVLTFFGDYLGDQVIESILDDIPMPEVSNAAKHYAETGDSEYDIIKNYLTGEELEELNEIISQAEAEYNKSMSIDSKNELDSLTKKKDIYDTIHKSAETNAKRVRTMLGGLTPADGVEYAKRLHSITAIFVEDSENIAQRKLITLGVDKDYQKDYKQMANYIKELMLRTDEFSQDGASFTIDVDFDKIGMDAEAKFKGNKNVTVQAVHEAYDTLMKDGRNFESDKFFIYNKLNELTSASARLAYINKMVTDTIKGDSELNFFAGKEIIGNTENIIKITDYITRTYNKMLEEKNNEYVVVDQNASQAEHEAAAQAPKNLEELGLTPQAIKTNAEKYIDGELLSKEMLLKFNDELNLYNVVGDELSALNEAFPNTKDPNYLRAIAKTDGLRCEKDHPMLDDAIATYARLKDIHNNRSTFYWLFHPVNNRAENRALKEMETTLKERYGFTDQELQERANNVMHMATDPINMSYIKATDKVKYDALKEVKKANKAQRDNVIDTKLDNIAKYGTLEVPKEKMPGVEVVHTRILKKGAVIDNVNIEEPRPEKTIEQFINGMAVREALLKSKPDIYNSEANKEEDRHDIEKFVDFYGYMKDKEENINALNQEISELKALDESRSNPKKFKVLKELYELNKKVRDDEKKLRTLNTEERLDKFGAKLDEYENSLEEANIAKADGEEKAKLMEEHNNQIKVREENEKQRQAYANKRDELRNKINENLEKNREERDLNKAYTEQFNSLDDTKRSAEITNQEEKTLNAMKANFGLEDLEKDTKMEEPKEVAVDVQEVKEEVVQEKQP